jgi:hypothetical protein
LSALSQFSTPTFFVRFSSTNAVQCAVWIFVSNHRFVLAAGSPFFDAYFLSTVSSFIRLYRTCLTSVSHFVLHRFLGARFFPAKSWFWISPLVRAWASYSSRSVYVLLQPDSRSSCQAEVVRSGLQVFGSLCVLVSLPRCFLCPSSSEGFV